MINLFKKKKPAPLTSIIIPVYGRMGDSLARCASEAKELSKRLGVCVLLKHPVSEITFFPDGREINWTESERNQNKQ